MPEAVRTARRTLAPPSWTVSVLIGLLAGGLTVYLSFTAGGFFAGTPAALAVAFGIALAIRITVAREPFAGLGPKLALAGAALGLYCAWTLASALWSDAPAVAVIEFDRALLYWMVLVFFGSFAYRRQNVRWAIRATVLAVVAICTVALLTRLFPEALPTAEPFAVGRLSYPLTYWNALGLLGAIGAILAFHLTASEREPVVVRALAAAALPVLAATIYFTFSRGAIAVAGVGLLAYVVLAHPRGLPSALIAVGPLVAVVLIGAYGSEELSSRDPTTAVAADEGRELGVRIALCALGALVLRLLLTFLDRALARMRVSSRARSGGAVVLAALAAVTLVAAFGAFDAGGWAQEQYDRVFNDSPGASEDDVRARFRSDASSGRVDHWNVALDAFGEQPVRGTGGGTYARTWARERETAKRKVEDAHSLYLETLAELGIVGMGLLGVCLAAIAAGCARGLRGPGRHVAGALLAAFLAWAVHAGIDWDWEVPAVTIWLFALGGLCLAAEPGPRGTRGVVAARLGGLGRVVLGLVCLGLVATPALVAVSQRHLNESVAALKRGDCGEAIDTALAASNAMPIRPEPLHVIGFCDVRLGETELAVDVLEQAVARDRGNWESWYGLALVRGADGQDPRAAVRRTLALNPLEPVVLDLRRRFRTDSPRKWRRRALGARLPVLP